MATNVFPVTDQVATKVLFDGAKNAIDHGATDIFSNNFFTAQNYETDLKLVDSSPGSFIRDATLIDLVSVEVPKGTTWVCRVDMVLRDDFSTVTSPADDLKLVLSTDSGVICKGIAWTKLGGVGTAGVTTTFINMNGSTQTINPAKPATNPDQYVSENMKLILVGDTASGSFTIQAAKANNLYTNEFQVLDPFIYADRIL